MYSDLVFKTHSGFLYRIILGDDEKIVLVPKPKEGGADDGDNDRITAIN